MTQPSHQTSCVYTEYHVGCTLHLQSLLFIILIFQLNSLFFQKSLIFKCEMLKIKESGEKTWLWLSFLQLHLFTFATLPGSNQAVPFAHQLPIIINDSAALTNNSLSSINWAESWPRFLTALPFPIFFPISTGSKIDNVNKVECDASTATEPGVRWREVTSCQEGTIVWTGADGGSRAMWFVCWSDPAYSLKSCPLIIPHHGLSSKVVCWNTYRTCGQKSV